MGDQKGSRHTSNVSLHYLVKYVTL